jgi:hypothetical protein
VAGDWTAAYLHDGGRICFVSHGDLRCEWGAFDAACHLQTLGDLRVGGTLSFIAELSRDCKGATTH